MKDVGDLLLGLVLFVNGIFLVCYGFNDPQRQGSVIAGAIIVAAAYLGGRSSVLRRQPGGKDKPPGE